MEKEENREEIGEKRRKKAEKTEVLTKGVQRAPLRLSTAALDSVRAGDSENGNESSREGKEVQIPRPSKKKK